MKGIYQSYSCNKCKREMILLVDQVESAKQQGKYLSCAYCGTKKITKQKETDDLRECMKERRYKRVKGALRQVE